MTKVPRAQVRLSSSKTAGAVVATLVVEAAVLITLVWLAMLLVGVAHSEDPRVPSLGYDVVLSLGVAARLLLGSGGSKS